MADPAELIEQVRGAVARGWCHPKNGHKEMDADLANAIVEQVMQLAALAPPATALSAEVARNRIKERFTDEEGDKIIAALTPQPPADAVALVDALINDAISWARKGLTFEQWKERTEALKASEAACLARMAGKVPEGWQPLSTLEHRHAYDAPLVMDGKNMPATYLSDSVILTDGKRVWVERSVIMGGALSSSADKFTAYPSGDKPTHWMPLPAAPKVPT